MKKLENTKSVVVILIRHSSSKMCTSLQFFGLQFLPFYFHVDISINSKASSNLKVNHLSNKILKKDFK